MRILAGKGAVYAAIALGLLTSFLAWRYVNQAGPSQAAMQTVPVVVASAPIDARTVITPQLVRIQMMPADAVHPESLQSVDQVVNKVAKESMTTDEPILTSKLYLQQGDSGLAFMVPQGLRAVSVAFNETMGSGGMVTPGDHVDVMGVFDAPSTEVQQANQMNGAPSQSKPTPAAAPSATGQDQGPQTVSFSTLVLQDVEVLAVAQQLEGQAPPSSGMNMPGTTPPNPNAIPNATAQTNPQPAAKTATLAVTPEDALKLVLAQEKGHIVLALRRSKDTDRPVLADVPMDALLMSAH